MDKLKKCEMKMDELRNLNKGNPTHTKKRKRKTFEVITVLKNSNKNATQNMGIYTSDPCALSFSLLTFCCFI